MTDKQTCPFCQAQWPDAGLDVTECPECGRVLKPVTPGGQSDQTIDLDAQTLNGAQLGAQPHDESRIDETHHVDPTAPGSDAAADSGLVPPAAPEGGRADQTIDFDKSVGEPSKPGDQGGGETIDLDRVRPGSDTEADSGLVPPLQPPADVDQEKGVKDAAKTNAGLDATLDSDSTPLDLGFAAGDPRLEATLDSTGSMPHETGFLPPSYEESTLDQDSVNIGFSGTASDTAEPGNRDQTLDSKDLPDDPARISQMWSRNFDSSLSVGMSLKGDAPSIGSTTNLVIQSRELRPEEDPQASRADYEMLGLLGEGGMGVVYAARQGSIDRTVALKMLKPDGVQDPKLRQKFLSEAVVTGDLEHPNIVPIYDLGANESGALFYAMKRVRGTPWDSVIAEQSQQENLEILMKVADALGFAHSRRVIHRDLKPENVMLGDFGEVLVMDWGLAVTEENVGHSGMGGTPAYMAPEMAAGPMEIIGPASDIYLLGAILYEMITGKRPHAGKDVMDCLMAAARNEIQPTEKEGELLKIAMKAMETEVDDRYPTVGDFQSAMREYQAHSESIALSTRAADDLQDARKSDDYQEYARAMFGFEEAFALWDGNDTASAGIVEARQAYAASALRKADFDLGISLLDASEPSNVPLLNELTAARDERDARQLRLKTAKRVGVGLAAMLFIVITGAFFLVRASEQKAIVAKEDAIDAQKEEEKAKEAAIEAQKMEKEAKEAAIDAQKMEKEAKEAAIDAQKLEKEAKEAALLAQELEKKAKEAAILAEAEAVKAKQQEERGAYVARIGLAAAKIDENAFGSAREILSQCPPHLRNWEWGRLMHLCTQDVHTFDGTSPIDAIAYSPDGSHFVTGGWDGVARIWDVETKEVVQKIPIGAEHVHAVAYSPDGQSIATGSNEPGRFVCIWDVSTGEQIRNLEGHTDSVVSVQFSKDGSKLLTSSYDETARLWDVATGEEKQMFIGHEWWVWSARFSPDEQEIVTASQDGTAIVWSVASGKPGPPFRGHKKPVFAARFSPDGRFVVSGGYDNRVLIWEPGLIKPFDVTTLVTDRENPEPPYRELTGHRSAVRSVAFSADGKRVLSGGHDNTVRVWDVASATPLKVLRGHAGRVRSCTFLPDDSWVLSASHDGTAKLWSIEGYEEKRVFRGRVLRGHRDAVLSGEFAPDGKRIVSASRDRTARIWSTDSGAQIVELKEGHDFLASRAVFFPNGKRVITSAVDNSVRVWDVASGTELHRLDGTGAAAAVDLSSDTRWILTGSDGSYAKLWDAETGVLKSTFGNHSSEVTAVQFSPDSGIVVTGDRKGRIRLSDRSDGSEIWSAHSHSRAISAAYFTPDGATLLTASHDNTVGHWNAKDGREDVKRILRHPDAVLALAISPDGKQAITTCADKVVRLWDIDTATMKKELFRSTEPINAVAFASNGRWALATETDGLVRLLDIETGTERKPADEDDRRVGGFRRGHRSVWSAIFAPGDKHVLTVGGNEARLWDRRSDEEIMTFTPHGSVASANFSPDGRRVATGSWDNTARIWDSQTGDAILKLEGKHTRHVNTAVFSPDGSQVLTASDDGTVRLWDAGSGEHLLVFEGHKAGVRSAVFSKDGKRILTASNDKTARTWDLETGKQLLVLEGHEWSVLGAAFSPNGKRIITASDDNSARLYDADSGEPLDFDLAGHTAGVTTAEFAPDSRRVITGSEDGTAKIWDAETGKELVTLTGHTRGVTSVKFSPDGRSVLSCSRDGTSILWMTSDWTGEMTKD